MVFHRHRNVAHPPLCHARNLRKSGRQQGRLSVSQLQKKKRANATGLRKFRNWGDDNRMTLFNLASFQWRCNLSPITEWGLIVTAEKPSSFHCPNCNALYRVVEVEPGPETVEREINCRSCGSPLASRKGKLVLKYFLVRKADRTHRQRIHAR